MKCHLLVSGFKHEVLWADIGGKCIWESTEKKLLGLHIDRDLKFTSHVSKLLLLLDISSNTEV